MIAKTEEEVAHLREAGRILAEVLQAVAAEVAPGVHTSALDLLAERLIRERGAVPAFLHYQPEGAVYPFPAVLCISINEEVVHGIPSERVIEEGDLVMLDLGLSYNGYFSDTAITVCAGTCDESGQKLIDATREALDAAIAVIKPGAYIGDISAAIEATGRKYGLGIVADLGGHSLGTVPHEGPFVSNVGKPGTGEKLVEGQVLAVEPIFTEGGGDIVLGEDDWTYLTADDSRSAEFEHTILVTRDGAEVLTRPSSAGL